MRVESKQSDLQLTRATACVGVSPAEARTTANGSSGVSKQPSHPPLVPFFSAACRLRPPTSSKAGYFSKHTQSQTIFLFFSFKQRVQVLFFEVFFLAGEDVGPSWTQLDPGELQAASRSSCDLLPALPSPSRTTMDAIVPSCIAERICNDLLKY